MIRAAALLLALPLCAAPLVAQTQPQTQPPWEPTLMFSINLGLTNNSSLWTLPGQPQAAPNNGFDTLALSRVLRPGLVAGVGATYFLSPDFGLSAEVTYFGIASEQRCAGPAVFQPDSLNLNQEACTRANGAHVNTSIVGFLLGATYQMSKAERVRPFVRATIGPGIMGSSYVTTVGQVTGPAGCASGCNLFLFEEANPPQFTFVTNLSAGLTVKMSDAYRFRMEFHDVITSLTVASGPHPPNNSEGPTSKVVKHIPTITLGLDLLLERRRARRY